MYLHPKHLHDRRRSVAMPRGASDRSRSVAMPQGAGDHPVSRVRSLMVDQAAPAPVTLRRDAIGLREVLFQSITDMAPGAAIAASIPAGAAFAGGSQPLAVLFA